MNANNNTENTLHVKRQHINSSHPLEINLNFSHNHVINSATSLSFRHVDERICEEFINLFKDGHSSASALYVYEDKLYLNSTNEQELLEKYREVALGCCNGKPMFERLSTIIEDYNTSGLGKAVMQEYDANSKNAFILCIVTNLMARVHEKIIQAGEICYVDASASFDSLNTSVTLLYTSCAAGALPLGLFLTSDETETTLINALNLLKTILPQNAFYGRGPQVDPMIFLTDNSAAERNALRLCWPEDASFYASLSAYPFLQSQDDLYTATEISTSSFIAEWKEPNNLDNKNEEYEETNSLITEWK
ncbi:6050_t:CDS:2 [Scutellospora calospora]|uniref:6050_t:CDS:1 n=1 Tax=Scutellospora calospora TaxID=85575 RepID=A0ACA9KM39_9GLOM|nr:6050_t:CDS:2 [Scutellospora calospora]